MQQNKTAIIINDIQKRKATVIYEKKGEKRSFVNPFSTNVPLLYLLKPKVF